MLQNSFIHILGIGPVLEKALWDAEVFSWKDVLSGKHTPLNPRKTEHLRHKVGESSFQLSKKNAEYFDRRIPSEESWRMFPEFKDCCAYLDIETTGLGAGRDEITTIVVYDGEHIRHYVQGRNLQDFVHDIKSYRLLVTYNGSQFDIPFLKNYFRIHLPQAQIDLRFILASVGIKGGMKGCERQVGIDRKDLTDMDGYFAVLLWREYRRHRNEGALQTLLAYNAMDVVHLEYLMHHAYNLKIQETPFAKTHGLEIPPIPEVPFEPHLPTIERLKVRWDRVQKKPKVSVSDTAVRPDTDPAASESPSA